MNQKLLKRRQLYDEVSFTSQLFPGTLDYVIRKLWMFVIWLFFFLFVCFLYKQETENQAIPCSKYVPQINIICSSVTGESIMIRYEKSTLKFSCTPTNKGWGSPQYETYYVQRKILHGLKSLCNSFFSNDLQILFLFRFYKISQCFMELGL